MEEYDLNDYVEIRNGDDVIIAKHAPVEVKFPTKEYRVRITVKFPDRTNSSTQRDLLMDEKEFNTFLNTVSKRKEGTSQDWVCSGRNVDDKFKQMIYGFSGNLPLVWKAWEHDS